MRLGLALTLTVTVGCGGTGHPELLDTPPAAPASFVNYRPDRDGCIFGDCVSGAYAKRIKDHVISGVVGQPSTQIDWESGPCRGWRYTGPVEDDHAQGLGMLVPRGPNAFKRIASQFQSGTMVGEAQADVSLLDDEETVLHAALTLDSECTIHFVDPTAVTLDAIKVGSTTSRFHGAVVVAGNQMRPLRGTLESDPFVTRYVEHFAGGWAPGKAAVCLSGDCYSTSSVELVGGTDLELYEGDFANGEREGSGRVTTIAARSVRDISVDYDAGVLREALISRQRYRIVCRSPDAIPLTGTCSLDVGLPESGGTVAFEDGALTLIESPTGELNGVAGVSALASARIAMAALLEQDLPRGTGSPTITIARERPSQVGGVETVDERTVATTDGTRILALSDVATGTSEVRKDRPHLVNFVTGTWLAIDKLYVITGLTFTTNGQALAHLHGDGTAIDPNGKHVAVVFYDGTRIDTLGYENVRDYEKTSPKARVARAKKLAQAAAAARAKDTHLVLALRRVRTSITMATGLITTARTAIQGTATDALGWERVIRSAHAAIEQADDAIIDAGRGADEAVKRLGPNDPCADPLAVVGADIHDLDDRLSTLMRALDAFTYSEDAARLEEIAKLVADGVAALPGSRITAHLATLQTFVNGAPQPMPAIVPEPSPKAKAEKTDATTPSPPP